MFFFACTQNPTAFRYIVEELKNHADMTRFLFMSLNSYLNTICTVKCNLHEPDIFHAVLIKVLKIKLVWCEPISAEYKSVVMDL